MSTLVGPGGLQSLGGRYRLARRVATGGMGEVYRGVDVGWGGIERPVAVKVIASNYAREPDFVRTFVDEARLSFLLCHANVVQVRDIGEVDQTWFIAMEWVEGGDLGAILRRVGRPLATDLAVLVAVEAARGLDYAHRLKDAAGRPLNVVHRDISPSNLLISFEGEVKISDFGIARWRLKSAPSMPGALKGKIGYLSPEQARGDDVDARADVFALGAVLYEMATGANPFTHNATERQVLTRVQTGSFAPPRQLLPSLPEELERILLRAMAPDRGARYPTCGALREDLEAFARSQSYARSLSDLGAFVRDTLGDAGPPPSEPEPAPSVSLGSPTAPGKRLSEIARAPAAPSADSLPDQIARSYSPRAAWLAIGLALLAGLISVGVSLAYRSASPVQELPPVIVSAPDLSSR